MITSNVTVDLQKLEKLLNKVSDLVIINSMMSQSVDNLPNSEEKKNISEKIFLFQRHIVELQDYTTDIRMIKFESMHGIYNDIIHELAQQDKNIKLEIIGGDTKVDKSLIEQLDDSFKTLITNAVVYRIETEEERILKDKNPLSILKIVVQQLNGQISFSVEDDGKGKENYSIEEFIDSQSMQDNKIRKIIEKLNGSIEIITEKDKGYSFNMFIPLSHSILDGLNIKIGDNIFILPTSSIVESIQPKKEMIKLLGDGTTALLMLRDEFIPIIVMHKYLNIKSNIKDFTNGILIIVKSGVQKAAIFIDEFLQQQQIVLKAIETNFRKVDGIAGATVRGDGSIGIILDVKNILEDELQIKS